MKATMDLRRAWFPLMLLLLPLLSSAQEREWAPTLQKALEEATLELREDAFADSPRLLFSAKDVPALKQKAAAHPDRWKNVLSHANSLAARPLPSAEDVAAGTAYWRIEFVQSGALAWLLTGEQRYFDAARNWMVRHCEGPIWGTGWNENVDLYASWYLYHISLAYDIMRKDLSEEDRVFIRQGLEDHARAIHDHIRKNWTGSIRYAQNHTYIPTIAMVTTALAIGDEVPQAREWIRVGQAIMDRSRHALGEDGYYYEGPGYWSYALHWHVRYADLMARATGANLFVLPALEKNWLYALHVTLPGHPWWFDMSDTGRWPQGVREGSPGVSQFPQLWAVASALNHPQAQLAANVLHARAPERDYPAAAFLWFDPAVQAADLPSVKPYHHFEDHDVVFWRSGWGEDATCIAFRCGPPQGHAAAKKLGQLEDWTMNSGHVHPDIGAFWLYARGSYLAGDTGYTAKKYTRDHNTLLVSDKGQGVDGSYWNDRGWPYERFNQSHIVAVDLADDHFFVKGDFSSVYPEELGKLNLTRTLAGAADWLLVVDELSAERKQTLTWFCHGDAPFRLQDGAWIMRKEDGTGLAVWSVGDTPVEATMEPTIVFGGTGPDRGEDVQRGHHLKLHTPDEAVKLQLATLLLPLRSGEAPPRVVRDSQPGEPLRLLLTWPSGEQKTVKLPEVR